MCACGAAPCTRRQASNHRPLSSSRRYSSSSGAKFPSPSHTAAAGRAFAAYGGVYIAASLAWMWVVEGVRPDRWDALGTALCLVGAAVILLAPRGA